MATATNDKHHYQSIFTQDSKSSLAVIVLLLGFVFVGALAVSSLLVGYFGIELYVPGAIAAGLMGTGIMTMMMYTAPKMGMPRMDILGLLGTMFTFNRSSATWLGAAIHSMMGIMFAIVYALAWTAGFGNATWLWGLAFGYVHGVAAILMMPLILRVHPSPPKMDGGIKTMVGQIVGHMVFGLLVALTYGLVA